MCKSTWVKNLITHQKDMIDPTPEHVICFYGEWQPLYNTLSGMLNSEKAWLISLPSRPKNKLWSLLMIL